MNGVNMTALAFVLAVIFVALNIRDITLTNELIEKGHTEANPVARKAMEWFDNWWPIIKLPAVVGVFYLAYHGVWWANLALVALYVWVVLHNLKIARG